MCYNWNVSATLVSSNKVVLLNLEQVSFIIFKLVVLNEAHLGTLELTGLLYEDILYILY